MKIALGFLLSISLAIGAFQAQAAAKADGATGTTPAKKLPYGVEDVLKLSQAQVNEEIIVKYIQNSGTVYNLSPETIVYLKNEGVADNVVNAMLDQPKNVAAASGTTSTWVSQAPAQVQPQQQAAPVYTQPPQPDPTPAPAPPRSTVYVIPSAPAVYAWPGYYGAYSYGPGWYGGFYGPRLSVGVGFGFGGHHHGHFRCW